MICAYIYINAYCTERHQPRHNHRPSPCGTTSQRSCLLHNSAIQSARAGKYEEMQNAKALRNIALPMRSKRGRRFNQRFTLPLSSSRRKGIPAMPSFFHPLALLVSNSAPRNVVVCRSRRCTFFLPKRPLKRTPDHVTRTPTTNDQHRRCDQTDNIPVPSLSPIPLPENGDHTF